MSKTHSLIIMRSVFDEELNKKFRKLQDGKIQADFGAKVSFVKNGNNRNIDEFKRKFSNEYHRLFDDWFDMVHPY